MLEHLYFLKEYKNIKYLQTYSYKDKLLSKNLNIIWQSAGNQKQICFLTKRNFSSVGTSETARERSFHEWLAGLIDGDGCFLISKEGYPSLEITLNLADEKPLMQIKQQFGGSVKLRSGSKSIRYRLHNKPGLVNLINSINGEIRNTIRITQLKNICTLLNIKYLETKPLTINNSWIMGFFDSDGCITGNLTKENPNISINIANKYIENLDIIIPVLKGNIYFSKHGYGHYVWSIQSKQDINNFLNYAKLNPSRTTKIKRLTMIKEFYRLRECNANKADISTQTYKAWLNFIKIWKDHDTVQV